MQDDKNKVEALLFITGKFLSLDEVSRMSGLASKGYLKDLLISLQEEYKNRSCSLSLVEEGDKWKLAVRKEYISLSQSLLTDSEMDKSTQETLAVIAYKSPVYQSDIIKIRGNGAYDHIKNLKELGLIVSEKSGRTAILKLTPQFYDYFDIAEEALKKEFSKLDALDGEVSSSELGKAMQTLFG